MFSPFRVPVARALAGSVAATLLLGGCAALTGRATGGDDQVVAAFYPLAWVTGRVAGENYQVANLTQPGGEPHDLELSIRATADVERAALVVFEQDFQPGVDAAVEQNAEGEVLDVADVVELRPFVDHSGEGHDHEDDGALRRRRPRPRRPGPALLARPAADGRRGRRGGRRAG